VHKVIYNQIRTYKKKGGEKMLKDKKGFTLIELLIVIVIIGILAGIVVGIVGTSARKKANDAKSKSYVHEVQNALEQYYVDNEEYPEALTTMIPDLLTQTTYDAAVTNADKPLTYTPAADADVLTYTLSFELRNQNDSGENIEGTSPTKVYIVRNKQ